MNKQHYLLLLFGVFGCSSENSTPKEDAPKKEDPTEKYKSMRAEIPANMKAIKIQQISYMQDYDVYVSCAAYPSKPSKEPQTWEKSGSGGFKTIDFTPNGDVRGSYMVSTSSTNFTVIGISDVDGDGKFATYIATKTNNPDKPITPPDVY